jgi:hypothetical protein
MASDDLSDVAGRYRYVMNGSELSMFGVGSTALVSLSKNLWDISPEAFSVSHLSSEKAQR